MDQAIIRIHLPPRARILGVALMLLSASGCTRFGGGKVAAPGLYAMGLPFMRRRKSSFLFGVDDDARDISTDLAAYVRSRYHARSVSVA